MSFSTALARRLKAFVCDVGNYSFVYPSPANTYATFTVSFNLTFPVPPSVTVTLLAGQGSNSFLLHVESVTTTGFTFGFSSAITGSGSINWQAILFN